MGRLVSRYINRRAFSAGLVAATLPPLVKARALPGRINPMLLGGDVQTLPNSFFGIAQNNGLGSGMTFAFDAGSIGSYSLSSANLWYDEVQGMSAWLGTSSTASTSNSAPGFSTVGTPGNLSSNEFFNFSSGKFFEMTTGYNSILDAWHSTLAAWTVISLSFNQSFDPSGGTIGVMGPNGGSASVMSVGISGGVTIGKVTAGIQTSTNGLIWSVISTLAMPAAQYNLYGAKVDLTDVSTVASEIMMNSSVYTFSSTRSAVLGSSINSTFPYVMHIFGTGLGAAKVVGMVGWSRRLSNAEYLTFYNAVKSLRYSTLP